MKKFIILAGVLAMAAASQAQAPAGLPFTAVGYDSKLNHVTASLPLGADRLDIGLGFQYTTDPAGTNENLSLGVSGYYVKTLNNWGPVANNVAGGIAFTLLETGDPRVELFAGFQPEITLLERLVVGTRFGVNAQFIEPAFLLQTVGDPISIVQGLFFKVRF
jgi:hypothetical protein